MKVQLIALEQLSDGEPLEALRFFSLGAMPGRVGLKEIVQVRRLQGVLGSVK